MSSNKLISLTIRCAIGTADDLVSTSMQCEAVRAADAEMQFANGNDDTEFENLMAQLGGKRVVESDVVHISSSKVSLTDNGAKGLVSQPGPFPINTQASCARAQRLPVFVRNMAPVVEILLEQLNYSSKADTVGNNHEPNGDTFLPSAWRAIGENREGMHAAGVGNFTLVFGNLFITSFVGK